MTYRAINFVLFYVAWFACVLSMGSSDRWWWSLAGTVLAVGWHLSVSKDRRRDLISITCAVLIGPLVDTVALALGALRFPAAAPQLFNVFPPLAMILLWAVFATTFHSSLGWLVERRLWLLLGSGLGGRLPTMGERS